MRKNGNSAFPQNLRKNGKISKFRKCGKFCGKTGFSEIPQRCGKTGFSRNSALRKNRIYKYMGISAHIWAAEIPWKIFIVRRRREEEK